MPGVPPDAVAQIKKSLRGLFGRKKKNQSEARPTSDPKSEAATTAAAPASATSAPPATQSDPNPPAPQPSTTASADKADATAPPSGPAAPTPSEPQLQKPAVPESSIAGAGNPTGPTTTGTASNPTTQQKTTGGTGMSATSGPLDDQHEFSDVGREGTGAAVPLEGSGVGSASKPVNVDAVKT